MTARYCALILCVFLTACAAPHPARDRAPSDAPFPVPEEPETIDAEPGSAAVEEALVGLRAAVGRPDFHPETALALLLPLTTAELLDLYQQHAGEARLVPWLDLAAVVRPHLLDDAKLQQNLIEWANRHPRAGYYPGQAREWIGIWREITAWPEYIVVLLPGDGPLFDAGVALRDGLISEWLEIPGEHRPQIDFLELPATAEAAAGARFEAQARGADFIIGPLDRRQIDILLRQPDSGIPMLLLNQPDQPDAVEPDTGLHYFLALPPEEEAEQAAIQALAVGHQGVILLEQNTAWGTRIGNAFASRFEAGGGRIIEQHRFDPGESDHSRVLESALGFERSVQRANRLQTVLGQPVNFDPVLRPDVDFIFLAGRDRDVRMLKPQLAYVGAGHLPVFGTSHLYSGGRGAGRAEDLDGLEFPIAPWFVPGLPQGEAGQRAQAMYANLTNPTLAQLHALGRDALALVRWLDDMQQDPELYLPGMTGRLYLTDGSQLQRFLPWVRLQGNALRLVPE